MEATLVISFYKNLANLELLLLALNNQSALGRFEVIISEDDDDVATINFLDKIKPKLKFPITHHSRPDTGFTKCASLNNAITNAHASFMIFIDGDCIPHKKFVEAYLANSAAKTVLFGRRVMLSESLSKLLLVTKNLRLVHFTNLLWYKCKRVEEGIYLPFMSHTKTKDMLLGCNMGINRDDLIAINGFDEDYVTASGGEDTDIEWRLKHLDGIKFKSMKFKAIQYHLYHVDRFTPEIRAVNMQIINNKIAGGAYFCKNGLVKIN